LNGDETILIITQVLSKISGRKINHLITWESKIKSSKEKRKKVKNFNPFDDEDKNKKS